MALPHGRGKQSFRDFNKSLRDELKDIREAIRNGEEYTANDISRFLTRIVNEYVQDLRAQELDVELWGDRAIDKAYDAGEDIITEFQLNEESIIEEEAEANYDNEEVDQSDTEGDGSLFGFPLVTSDNKSEVRGSSVPRKRFMVTLEELYEYISKVPYVTYIQIIDTTEGGKVYRVWVEEAKQKKRRKSV